MAWRILFQTLRCRISINSRVLGGQTIIETDCAGIVQMMEVEDCSAISFIMADAMDHTNMLVDWRIAKVKRECNLIIHES